MNYSHNRYAMPFLARPQAKICAGFTLIELMVAIVISFLVILALIAVFLNISRTNTEMAKTNSQIENGRAAIQLLKNDIIHAGFWGGRVPRFENLTVADVPGDVPTAVPDPCLAYASWDATYINNLLAISVQGYDTAPAGCGSVVDKLADTDVLVVRHVETCKPGDNGCEVDTVGKLYFQASFCEKELNPLAPTTPTPFVLAQTKSPDDDFTLKKKGCTGTLPATTGTPAEKRKFVSTIYYIRSWARTAGDGIPTLMRSRFDVVGGVLAHQAAEPLIEGIQGFRVEFGVDNISDVGTNIISDVIPANRYSAAIIWNATKSSPGNRGDGSPDTYVLCPTAVRAADTTAPSTYPAATVCTADQLANVVALKVHVLARSETESPGHSDIKTYFLGPTTLGPFNDKFKRHVFSAAIRLVNPSGRRETP